MVKMLGVSNCCALCWMLVATLSCFRPCSSSARVDHLLEVLLSSMETNDLEEVAKSVDVDVDKRGFVELGLVTGYMTGRNPLKYNDYGCYCGAGNAGFSKKPLDKVDTCCREHDLCFKQMETECPGRSAYFAGYSWKKTKSYGKKDAKCTDSNRCKLFHCNCDVEFGRCLQDAGYKSKYKWNWFNKKKNQKKYCKSG